MTLIEHNAENTLVIPEQGKFAILFHLPGHCAGCKVAVKTLEDKMLEDVTVVLVDAGDDKNKYLIDKYQPSMAPTMIVFNDGEIVDKTSGLREFQAKQKELLGD